LKEGTKIKMRITFKVYNDTVVGLDFRGKLDYDGALPGKKAVATFDDRLGSYGPFVHS
jgi:hypothetical protein